MASGKKEDQLQRSVFRWVQAADDLEKAEGNKKVKNHATITAQEVARYYGVPDDTLRNYIRGEIEEETSCKSLPFTLVMFMSYTAVVMWHDPVIPINDVEESLTFDLVENANFAFSNPIMGNKGVHDINSATDFWSWIIKGFVPLVFVQERGFAEERDMDDPEIAALAGPVDEQFRGIWLNFNRIVGGVRVRQERGDPQTCTSLTILQKFYNMECQGTMAGSGYELYPERETARYTRDPQREFWLWNDQNQTTMLADLTMKEKDGWLDRGTTKIEIAIPVFNGNLGVYTILYIDFFFPRSGHIWKRILPMSTYSQWWHGWYNIVPDAMWILGLLSILFTELSNVCSTLTAKTGGGLRGIYHEYLSFWNIVDWTTVLAGGWVISGYMFRFWGTLRVNTELIALGLLDVHSQQAEYYKQTQVFIDTLAVECQSAQNFRLLLGMYPMLIVMRLFEAFAHQPRLSIVTSTLGDAFVDLAHFLLVFLSIFLTYAVAGVVLFGREVDSFTNVMRACNTCFRIMMGDFDWEELLEVGRMFAGVWFLSFVVIIVLLMLNMLLAIVMDAYSEQKARLGEAETLWQEFLQVFHRWRGERSGELRSLKEVSRAVRIIKDGEMAVKLHTFATRDSGNMDLMSAVDFKGGGGFGAGGDPDSPNTPKSLRSSFSFTNLASIQFHGGHGVEDFCLVTVDSLLDACPQMQEEQAMDLIQSAVKDYYLKSRGDTNIEEMCHIIRKVNSSTKRFKRHMIFSLKDMQRAQGIDISKVMAGADTSGHDPNMSSDHGTGTDDGEAYETGTMVAAASNAAVMGEVTMGGDDDMGHKNSMHPHVFGAEASDEFAHQLHDQAGSQRHFAGLLHSCRTQLHHIRDWISEEERRDVDPSASRVPMEFVLLQGLEDAVDFSVKRVLQDEAAVVRACRVCAIGAENDEQRARSLGEAVRILQKDARDNTVKCRVPGIGDIWFGLGALSQLRPLAIADADYSEARGKKDRFRETTYDTDRESHSGMSVSSETDGKQHAEEVLKRIYEMEIERRIGQQTVTEAINAVSELKWQQVKEKTDKSKLHQKILGLRKKLVSRAREHRRLSQEASRQEERLGILTQSRDEYMDLVSNLGKEKKKLEDRLKMLGMTDGGPLALEDQEPPSREERDDARSRERDAALKAMKSSSPRDRDGRRNGTERNDNGRGRSNGHDRERSRDQRR